MNKKWFILIAILLGLTGTVLYFLTWVSQASKLPSSGSGDFPCANWGIDFDSSSVEGIYSDPESISDDPLSFWVEDSAYSLVALAPWYQEGSIPPSKWVGEIEKLKSISAQDREHEPPKVRSAEIMDHNDIYCSNAMPVTTSALPEGTSLETKVYLSAFNDPEAFALRSNIVMNAGSKSYFGKTSKFFNLLSHEIFHVGYFNHQPHQTEVWPDNYPLHVILVTLQNDGIAVFIQHELHDLYPAPLEVELLLLDSELAVKFLLGRVNKILQSDHTLDEDESMQQAFSRLNQLALYVVGAYMADTIDNELGREALAQTVAKGPRSFIRAYNSVAEEGMKIHDVEEPSSLSSIQVLRKAAIEEDDGQLARILEEIREQGIQEPGGIVFENLMSTGLVLQSKDEFDLAIEVFELLVMLFPDYPFSYIYLADAYSEIGEMNQAQDAYRKAAELDSRFSSAFKRSLGDE